MEIRPGTSASHDAASAWKLFQAHLNWINVWHEVDYVVQRRLSEQYISQLFRIYPSAVAEEDGVIFGFLCSEIREIGVLEIMNFYVDDGYRDQGIGQALLRQLEELCPALGIHTILAFSSNRYYPGKVLPDGVFRRADYEVADLSSHTHMYQRNVPLTPDQLENYKPVRRLSWRTVEDLDDETPREVGEIDLSSLSSTTES